MIGLKTIFELVYSRGLNDGMRRALGLPERGRETAVSEAMTFAQSDTRPLGGDVEQTPALMSDKDMLS